MNKKLAGLLALVLLAALVLSGCGAARVFSVSTNEDNSISVTAKRGPEDSVGLGYLTVGEGGQVVVETHFKDGGEIRVTLFDGLLGSETFPDEPAYEIVTSGESTVKAGVESGEYTVAVKAANTVTGTAVLRVESGEPVPESGDAIGLADDSFTFGDLALRPDGEAGHLYENGGCTLLIPLEYDELLLTETPEDAPDGLLFSVSEKASLEAAGGEDGAGWLFGIRRLGDEQLHEALCWDRSGMEIFAEDDAGWAYAFCHPTDVRYFREDNEAMQRDQEIWTALNDWARSSVRETFLRENSGLRALSFDESVVALYLARAAYESGAVYTVSTTQYGPMEPKAVDGAPYAWRLLKNVAFEPLENAEAPDGEYVVLSFPEDGVRFDFFPLHEGESLVREVSAAGDETLYRVNAADGTDACAVMQAWYDALVAAQN